MLSPSTTGVGWAVEEAGWGGDLGAIAWSETWFLSHLRIQPAFTLGAHMKWGWGASDPCWIIWTPPEKATQTLMVGSGGQGGSRSLESLGAWSCVSPVPQPPRGCQQVGSEGQ